MLDDEDTRNDAYAATVYLAARTGYGMSSGPQSITFFDRGQYDAAARELEAEGFVFSRNDRDHVLLWTNDQPTERRSEPAPLVFHDIDDGVPEVSTERIRFSYDNNTYVYERWLSSHGSGSEYYDHEGHPTTAPFESSRELETFERRVDALCASYGERLNVAKQHIVESALAAANLVGSEPPAVGSVAPPAASAGALLEQKGTTGPAPGAPKPGPGLR